MGANGQPVYVQPGAQPVMGQNGQPVYVQPNGNPVVVQPVMAQANNNDMPIAIAVFLFGFFCYFPLFLINLMYWKNPDPGVRMVAYVSLGCFIFELLLCIVVVVWVVVAWSSVVGTATSGGWCVNC
jgi:hypothetical protein